MCWFILTEVYQVFQINNWVKENIPQQERTWVKIIDKKITWVKIFSQ